MDYSDNFNNACSLSSLLQGHKALNDLKLDNLMGSAIVVNISTSNKEVANVALYLNNLDDISRIKELISLLSAEVTNSLTYKKQHIEHDLRQINNILNK